MRDWLKKISVMRDLIEKSSVMHDWYPSLPPSYKGITNWLLLESDPTYLPRKILECFKNMCSIKKIWICSSRLLINEFKLCSVIIRSWRQSNLKTLWLTALTQNSIVLFKKVAFSMFLSSNSYRNACECLREQGLCFHNSFFEFSQTFTGHYIDSSCYM